MDHRELADLYARCGYGRGQERLVAVCGESPPDEDGARASLAASLDDARRRGGGIADMVLALPDEHATIWFQKP
jgi:hypothetical protein